MRVECVDVDVPVHTLYTYIYSLLLCIRIKPEKYVLHCASMNVCLLWLRFVVVVACCSRCCVGRWWLPRVECIWRLARDSISFIFMMDMMPMHAPMPTLETLTQIDSSRQWMNWIQFYFYFSRRLIHSILIRFVLQHQKQSFNRNRFLSRAWCSEFPGKKSFFLFVWSRQWWAEQNERRKIFHSIVQCALATSAKQ